MDVRNPNERVGGSDVFVDIGDKSWGVLCIQRFLGGIKGHRSLHVGDQFLSAVSNDFKVRPPSSSSFLMLMSFPFSSFLLFC